MNPKYVHHNQNPTGRPRQETKDCVIRAISFALGMDYYDVYDELSELAKEKTIPFNYELVTNEYLKNYPQIDEVYDDGARYQLNDVCDFNDKKGTYIVQLSDHMVAVKDGKFYDQLDCGNRYCVNIWEIVDKEE